MKETQGMSIFVLAVIASVIILSACNTFAGGGSPTGIHLFGTDDNDNLYIYGTIGSRTDFDPGEGLEFRSPIAQGDYFIARYDADNELVWVHSWEGYPRVSRGGTSSHYVSAIAVDPTDGVYLGGWFSGTQDIDFTEGTYEVTSEILSITGGYSSPAAFLAKLDGSGIFQWAGAWGSPYGTYVRQMEMTVTGDVLVVGTYEGQVDFDPGEGQEIFSPIHSGPSWQGGEDFYISRFDTDGNFKSVITWAYDDGVFKPGLIKLDSGDNIYIAGMAREELDILPGRGEFLVKPASNAAPYVVVLDPDGNFLWGGSWNLGDSWGSIVEMIVDSSGNVYILCQVPVTPNGSNITAGAGDGILTAGANIQLATSKYIEHYAYETMLVKFEPGGILAWEISFGGGGLGEGAYSENLEFNEEGNLVIRGWFSGTVDFDPGPDTRELTSEIHSESAWDRGDGYVCVFDSDGQLVEVNPSDHSEKPSSWGGPILAIGDVVTYEILETVRTMEVSNQVVFW